MIIGEYRLAQMFKFNNSIVPSKVRIGWHFSSNKYAYRDAYSAHKNKSSCGPWYSYWITSPLKQASGPFGNSIIQPFYSLANLLQGARTIISAARKDLPHLSNSNTRLHFLGTCCNKLITIQHGDIPAARGFWRHQYHWQIDADFSIAALTNEIASSNWLSIHTLILTLISRGPVVACRRW